MSDSTRCRPPLPDDAIEHFSSQHFAGPCVPSFPTCMFISISGHINPQPPFPIAVDQQPVGRWGLALQILLILHGPTDCLVNLGSLDAWY